MGQQQSQEQRPLNDLIKDVATFNLLAKSPTIKSSLGKQLLAEVTKRKQDLFDSIPFVKKQDDLCIGIFVEKEYFQITQQKFYYCKQLLEDFSSILMVDPQKEEGTCQICFEKKIDKLLPCGHSYCQDCIEGWFTVKEQDSCPMCRAQLTKQKMKSESYVVPNEAELIDSFKEQLFLQFSSQK
ncbi:unnamed protein product (macronuclear) [Paramecium tetraurelia]|uniref:RING-type domain-containing protein n=1 Tax=Paramecium tetraurelia TaxID=5888 RepID=A0EAJ9_PARTE|nr:uncharacterized protein GSPATT00025050001 [Paramecium tetraurelia]CAK92316.1 unnamed protein product [Paramecium tetraurelia]|eukprot:XP_001459713.1 hypothetical protein (macronuclear) [Paramecium tetraurelia strain d4-2]